MRWSSPAVWVLSAFVLAIGGGLWYFAPIMAPVKECNSAQFWSHACGVNIGEPSEGYALGGVDYTPRDGYLVCYDQGFHGTFLYRVREEAVVRDIPQVVREMDGRVCYEDSWWYRMSAYQEWRADGGAERRDVAGLLARLRESWLAWWEQKNPRARQQFLAEQARFEERWRRTRRYWLNIAFEAAYLTALAAFLCWPWLRRKGVCAWCVHLGLFPLLLYLPYFLGYASFTLTSAGPSGGVLYPWLIVWLWGSGFWTPLDTAFFRVVPRALEPISQRLGPMLSLSGGSVGVVFICVLGSALACVPLLVVGVRWRWREGRKGT